MPTVDPRAVEGFEAHVRYMSELARSGGGRVVERGGMVIFRSVVNVPFLVNGAARLDPAVDAQTVINAAGELFGRRGFELVCLGGRDADLRAAGLTVGMKAGETADPIQWLDRPVDAGPVDASGLEVRRVMDAVGVADAGAVNQDASDIYEFFPPDFFAGVFGRPVTLLADNIRVYVAYDADGPVATSEYARLGDLCYVGWVAVVQRAMRRGLGRWITAHAVNEGFADGRRAAVLVASPMGAPLYRRMGFVDVGLLDTVYAAGDDAGRSR